MKKTLIKPDKVHKEVAKYSHGFVVEWAKKIIVLSGQVPVDKEGNIVPERDFEKHCRKAFENLRVCLEAAGAGFKDIVYLGVLLTDNTQWREFDRIRSDYLVPPWPATTLFCVKSLAHPDWMIEIEAIAATD